MKILGGIFDLEEKEKKLKELENLTKSSNFWNTIEKANKINTELSYLSKPIKKYNNLKSLMKSNLDLISLLNDENDIKLINELESNIKSLEIQINELEIETLLNGKYDYLNCYLEVHPGAGGTESQDWANMLLRMYQRFCDKEETLNYEMIEEQKSDEAGIKSCTMLIKGPHAYGYLKGEQGVHRLVRISPFDSNSRRHTSFASVSIIPEFEETKELEINDKDLKIDVFHSSGAGGQSVNTTDSAVRITHLATNIVVTCQNERSQLKNKEQAMKILKSKLYQIELEKQENELNNIKGEHKNIVFGSQIRNYTLEPYTLVKDVRTGYETSNAYKVLDGDIKEFIESYLRKN